MFLFEQALLFCKEIKDTNGKCNFEFKTKLKTSDLGITEHVAEDKCKFAVWTGSPPYTEEKRIIKVCHLSFFLFLTFLEIYLDIEERTGNDVSKSANCVGVCF